MANSKSKKRKKIIVFSLIGSALVVLTMAAILKKKEPIIMVQTEKVVRRNLTEIVVANGKIQPVTQVVISPEVAGEIVKLPVKEGDRVKQGDLLLQIKPDNYVASRNSAEANYKSATAGKNLAKAQMDKAEAEFKRNEELFQNKFVSDSVYLEVKTAYEVAKLQLENAAHQEDQARFGLDKAKDDLSKTTILSPMDGTVTRLQSQQGERVLGTSFNKGTEIMTISDLNEMEARVDIGEMDVVLIARAQNVRLEVDAFRDRKFTGVVTEIANSAKGLGQSGAGGLTSSSSSGQEATKFEVHIRIKEKEEVLRPGMSVTAEIETRYRTNVLTVPLASVTTRVPKNDDPKKTGADHPPDVEQVTAKTNSTAETSPAKAGKKSDALKPVEVVFLVDGDRAKMAPVKLGVSDDNYYEITEGLQEGQEVVSGSYRAIGRDLEDGKRVAKGASGADAEKKEL